VCLSHLIHVRIVEKAFFEGVKIFLPSHAHLTEQIPRGLESKLSVWKGRVVVIVCCWRRRRRRRRYKGGGETCDIVSVTVITSCTDFTPRNLRFVLGRVPVLLLLLLLVLLRWWSLL